MVQLVRERSPVLPPEVRDALRDALACNAARAVRFDAEPLDDFLLEWISRHDAAAGCKLERGNDGELVIMPVGKGGGSRIGKELCRQFGNWEVFEGFGESFDGTHGYDIPGLESVRCPDVSWVSAAKLAMLPSEHEQQGFMAVCPDVVVEIRSDSQSLREQLDRIEDWIAWGASVAWLIDPANHAVHVARAGQPVVRHDRPGSLDVGPEMPGFAVDFSRIWRD